MIDREGRVSDATPTCTSMSDRSVVACVLDKYKNLQFPPPDGGVVMVVYPIMFEPSD